MSRKVKVLIVDDSPTMRGLIASSLLKDPEVEVVGQAGDAHEARSAIKALNPDVVTLDVEMPKMTGLEFLEKIMRLRPTPVIMVSTLTKRGAEETIQALEIGAIDCIEKPRPGNEHSFDELPAKVKVAASARVRSLVDAAPSHEVAKRACSHPSYMPDGRVLAIGASTGGVEALIAILAGMPANCPPTVITQHMPESFTRSFANRLNKLCAAKVEQATDGARLMPGQVYLAPGGNAHLEIVGSSEPRCRLRVAERVNGHCPSVDVLFNSVAKTCQDKAVGVILTGMGKDGAAGLLAMRNAGCATFGQDESTCVVYGMPKAAMAIGAVQTQLPLERIGPAIISATAAR